MIRLMSYPICTCILNNWLDLAKSTDSTVAAALVHLVRHFKTTVFVRFIYSSWHSIASSRLVNGSSRYRFHHSCYFRFISHSFFFLLSPFWNWQLSRRWDTMKVRINLTKRKESSVKLSSMCIPYNERSNRGVYLVWQPINTLLYTIILCRIRAKLLTATIEQNGRETENERERERASVALIIRPIDYRSSWRHISACLILHAIVNSPLSFFPSLLVISLYSKKQEKKSGKSSANDPAAKCTQRSLPCMMFFTTTSWNISSGIDCLCNSISRKSVLIFHCHHIFKQENV